jgi:hypothetical protein
MIKLLIILLPMTCFAGVDMDKIYKATMSYNTARRYKDNLEDYIINKIDEKTITSMSIFYKILNTKKLSVQIKRKDIRYYIEFKPDVLAVKFTKEF